MSRRRVPLLGVVATSLVVGEPGTPSPEHVVGTIDPTRIRLRALTSAEIAAIDAAETK